MKRQSKLQSSVEQQQALGKLEHRQESSLNFATPEEMLRHDALHTPVPPSIARRLKASLAAETPTLRSWWQRLLGS